MTRKKRLAKSVLGNLIGKRAVVTGASSGIGREIALELARGGADVIVHYRTSFKNARQIANSIIGIRRRSTVLDGDLAKAGHRQRLVEAAWDEWNGLDIWVNCAGADLLTGSGSKLSYAEKLRTLVEVDLEGTVLVSKWIGERMRQSGTGTIINVGWDQADRGMEGDSGELFAASKNAIMGFTRSLAVSLAPSVRVNCVAPGWIKTAWGEQAGDQWHERVLRETPLARWGTPADVARLVRFLASDDASFITGQIINVNGGAIR